MMDKDICQNHQRKIEYCCFDSSISEKLLCSYCLENYQNNTQIISMNSIKEQILDQMEQLKQLKQQYQVQLTSIQNSLNYLLEKEENIKKIIKDIEISHLHNIVEEIETLFKLQNGVLIHNYQDTKITKSLYNYSDNLKNESIILINPFNAKKQNCTSNSLAIIEPQLNQFTEPITLYLKINKVNKSVAVGFCELDIVKKNSYTLNKWDSLGHGCYLISNRGCIFNAYQDIYNSEVHQSNSKMLGFCFRINQIIKMQYDQKNKEIRFELMNDPTKQIIMSINSNNVYACVYLSKCDDEIEIIQL